MALTWPARTIFVDARQFAHSGIGRTIRNHLTLFRDFNVQCIAGVEDWKDGARLRRWIEGSTDHIRPVLFPYSPHRAFQFLARVPVSQAEVEAYWFPQYSATTLRLPERSIVTVHDLIQVGSSEAFGSLGGLRYRARSLVARLALRRTIARAARIACVSKRTRTELLDLFPDAAEKVRVVEHGLMPSTALVLSEEQKRQVRQSFGINRFLLFVGIKEARKNCELLLSVFDRVAEQMPLLDLVIAGEEPRRPRKAEADTWDALIRDWRLNNPKRSDRLKTFGEVSEHQLWRLYAAADGLLVPSKAEGYGLPVAEALSCGTRVFSSDQVPSAEALSGFVTRLPIDNAVAWSEAIVSELGNTASRPTHAAADLLADQRTWRKATEELVDLVAEIGSS